MHWNTESSSKVEEQRPWLKRSVNKWIDHAMSLLICQNPVGKSLKNIDWYIQILIDMLVNTSTSLLCWMIATIRIATLRSNPSNKWFILNLMPSLLVLQDHLWEHVLATTLNYQLSSVALVHLCLHGHFPIRPTQILSLAIDISSMFLVCPKLVIMLYLSSRYAKVGNMDEACID